MAGAMSDVSSEPCDPCGGWRKPPPPPCKPCCAKNCCMPPQMYKPCCYQPGGCGKCKKPNLRCQPGTGADVQPVQTGNQYSDMMMKMINSMREQKQKLTMEIGTIETAKKKLQCDIRCMTDRLTKLNLKWAQTQQCRAELVSTINDTVESYDRMNASSMKMNKDKGKMKKKQKTFNDAQDACDGAMFACAMTGKLARAAAAGSDKRPSTACPMEGCDDDEDVSDGSAIAAAIANDFNQMQKCNRWNADPCH